jgi:hypothetical protein
MTDYPAFTERDFAEPTGTDAYVPFTLDALGIDDPQKTALDAITTRTRLDRDDHSPRAVLAFIGRVLDTVPDPTPTRTIGHFDRVNVDTSTFTPAPLAPTLPTHGRPRDVLAYIDAYLDRNVTRNDRDAHVHGGGTTIIVPSDPTAADRYTDRLITRLRRALALYRTAPDANPRADVLPDSLGAVIPPLERGRDGHLVRRTNEHRDRLITPTYVNADGNLLRRTYPSGPTTQQSWALERNRLVALLHERGLTDDDIIARVNAD